MSRTANYARKDRCLNFIWDEGEIDYCRSGKAVGAAVVQACSFRFAAIAGTLRDSFHHYAMMLAVATAADRHVRICCRRREERRDQRQHEQQQQRDGENTAHERIDTAIVGERLEPMTGDCSRSLSSRTLDYRRERNGVKSTLEARRPAREGRASAMPYRGQSECECGEAL